MKKLVVSIVLLVIVFVGYRIHIKKSPIDFIKNDTKSIIILDKISNKNFKELELILCDFMKKEDIEKLGKNKKYVSEVYIISDDELYNHAIDFVAIVDTGMYYYPALSQWKSYFTKIDDIYKTKEKYKEEIKNIFPNVDVLYADYKGGLFFVSNKIEYLKKYLEESEEKNKNLETIIKESKSNLYTFVYNNSNTKEFGMDFVTLTASLKDKEIFQNIKIYLNEMIYSFLDYQPDKRRLKDDITNDSIYISMEDFSKLEKIIFNQYNFNRTMSSLFSLTTAFLGINVKDEMKNIDGEVLIDFNNDKIIIALKDVERIKKLYGTLGKFAFLSNDVVEIDVDKKLLTLHSMLGSKKHNIPNKNEKKKVYIRKEQFLYGHITPSRMDEISKINPSDMLDLEKNLIKKDIVIKGVDGVIEIETIITKEDLLIHINNYREKIKGKK
ncbi:hypothetical protein [Fusobacterium sp. PH5-29]